MVVAGGNAVSATHKLRGQRGLSPALGCVMRGCASSARLDSMLWQQSYVESGPIGFDIIS